MLDRKRINFQLNEMEKIHLSIYLLWCAHRQISPRADIVRNFLFTFIAARNEGGRGYPNMRI